MKQIITKLRRAKFQAQCILQDALQNYRHMDNWHRQNPDYWKLSSELIFYFHKLEKGLALPEQKKVFGLKPAQRTSELIKEWQQSGFPTTDPIFMGAVETLRCYSQNIPKDAPKEYQALLDSTNKLLKELPEDSSIITPEPLSNIPDESSEVFCTIAAARRSVRNFKPEKVSTEQVLEAVKTAQMAPSACNRQPCQLHFFEKGDKQQKILSFQNGNRGFGHTVPLLAVVTSESKAFFDFTERNEPYLDAGLFLSYFLLALQSKGISSCCLNWCASPWHDQMVRKLLPIGESEKIISFLAIGYAEENCLVPRSPRRHTDTIAHFYDQ